MRIITIVALFAVILAGTAFAGDSGNGCKLQGTWMGEAPYPLAGGPNYYMLKMFVVYNGTGDTEGTEVSEWINPVPTPGTSWSNARGVWVKSGPHKYKYTKLGYSYDQESGDIVEVLRHTGTITITDCNTALVESSLEFSTPDMTPVMCVPYTVTLHRMLPAEPCQPQ
jgi:hypothetical protein